MTVNSHCSLLFLLFIESVYSLQNSFQGSSPICSYPYSCMPTNECAERHSPHGTDEVLFQCEGKKKICCPPMKLSAAGVSQGVTSDTGRPCSDERCQQNSQQTNRPVGVSAAGENAFTQISPQTQTTETRRPVQPMGSRRPTDVMEGRRPSQNQMPQSLQSGVQSSQNSQSGYQSSQNSQGGFQSSQNPQTSFQSSQNTQNGYQSPQNPQSGYQSPQNSQSGYQSPQNSQNGFQSSQSTQGGFKSPQSFQSGVQTQQSSQNGFPSRPQTPQMLSHSSNPSVSQKQSVFTSHRNFRLLPQETECGVNNFANRITEGEEVSLGEYPWMVLTGLKDKYGNYRWNCGGTLINGMYVLTAAHCLVVENRTIEYVRLGEHSLRNETDCYRDICLEPPEDVTIAEAIPHKKWNTTTIKNDIALLRLSKNVLKLGKSNIYPICLPLDIEKLNITSSTKYEVAGWGKTDWNADEGSDVLRKASISGVNREECNICKDKKKQQYCPIIDTQLCVQGWKSVDVCKGDSGGPLMVTRLNIYQIGITSFKGSEYCGAENIPSIFTKVESFLPWILDNIRG